MPFEMIEHEVRLILGADLAASWCPPSAQPLNVAVRGRYVIRLRSRAVASSVDSAVVSTPLTPHTSGSIFLTNSGQEAASCAKERDRAGSPRAPG